MTGRPSEGDLQRELREYYDPLLPIWDRTLASRGDLDFWRWMARRWRDRSVLEVGAGSGRVTEVFARRARRVLGLDLNPDALDRARARLSGAPSTALVLADMRHFALDARFHGVAAANDPFSHLRAGADRDAALDRISEHLSPAGEFVLDALWFPEAWREEAARPAGRTLEQREPAEDGGKALEVRQTWRCDRESARCTARFECRTPDGTVVRSVFVGRYWTRRELEARLRRAGLRIADLWGDYDGTPWSPDSSHLTVRAVPR